MSADDLIELIKVLQLRAEQCDRGNWYVSLSEMRTILDALAAKDAALSEMRAELERARKALKPFAKRAKDVTGPGYMTTVKDEWLTAARALASQDEGEER